MKRSLKFLTVLILLGSVSALAYAHEKQKARTQHHPEGPKTPVTMSGMDMDKVMQEMQDSMFKMHDLMNRILQTKDPQEVQRLKQEHLQLLKEHMQMMHEHMPMMHGMAKKNPPETKSGHTHETAPNQQKHQE